MKIKDANIGQAITIGDRNYIVLEHKEAMTAIVTAETSKVPDEACSLLEMNKNLFVVPSYTECSL